MTDWNGRVAAVWADTELTDLERIAVIDGLAAERDPRDALALFERAGARDSAGLETEAEALYRDALSIGLDEDHRVRAVIQLASTIRNLGRVDEALELLHGEYTAAEQGGMHDAVAAFYALALASHGQERAAASVALRALAPHLPRYTRSVTGYALELVGRDTAMPTANTGSGAETRR